MIIGLVGKNGAGKGEVAEVLKTCGFSYHSLSDVLRELLAKQGKDASRDNLTNLANELRASQGPGHLAVVIRQRLGPDHNYVIDSIRHPAEVEILRQCRDFSLMMVEADSKTRFERIRKRRRGSDTYTYDAFVAQEAKEAAGKNPTDQQINKTMDVADAHIVNNGTLEELVRNVKQIVQTLAMNTRRPGWDEYFMGIATQVALRSNCIKRKVAAILIKDQRIIATGYNGTPRGVKNCNEGGCPRCNQFGASGANLEMCLCSHAEENAIVQSAYHGVNIKGATLYTTLCPCLACAKMIINAGITEVVYTKAYMMDQSTIQLFKAAGVAMRQWER